MKELLSGFLLMLALVLSGCLLAVPWAAGIVEIYQSHFSTETCVSK